MPQSAAIFEKTTTEFFIKSAFFPVESKLQVSFWQWSYGIHLEKVNSIILEQIRIIEFCPFDHYRFFRDYLNHDVFCVLGIWEGIFTTNYTRSKTMKGVN